MSSDHSRESNGEKSRELREMNEELLISSLRQHELTEIAEKAEAEARRSEKRLSESNEALAHSLTDVKKLNIKLEDARVVAVGLMEDAVHSRDQVQQLNRELYREIAERKAFEDALQKSEEKYRTLYNSMDEGYCIIEFFDGPHGPLSDYVHVEANPAYTANAGILDVVGQKVREMVGDEADGWVEIYRDVLVTGKPVRFERELVATGRHLELAAFRIEPIERRQVAVLFKDITGRKRAQDDQEFLFRVAEMIRTKRNDEDLLADIAESLGKHLKVHRCLFNEIDLEGDTETVHRDYSRDGEHVAGRHKLSDYSQTASESMRDGTTVVNRDSKNDPRTADYFDKTYGPAKELAYIAVPMMREGRWVASLWCSDDKPRDWTVSEVLLVESIAERAWAAVEKLRADDALLRSEEKYRTLFESIDEGFCTIELMFDREGKPFNYRFLEANPAFVRQTGLENFIGKTMLDFAPDMEQFWFDVYGRIAMTGEAKRFQHEARELGRHYDVYAFCVGDGPAPRKVAVIFNDITERKLAEEGKARLAAIVESSDDAIIGKDLNGVIRSWNRGAEKLYGYTAEEAVGQSVTLLIPSDLRDEEPYILGRIRQGETIEHYETVRRRKDGTELYISLTVSPIRDEGGNIIGASKIARDITERKLAEEKIRASEKQHRLVTDAMPALISYVDKDERYRFVNKTYSEWFGMPSSELLGRTIIDVIGEAAYESVKPNIEKVMAGREISFETTLNYKVAGPRFVHVSYVPDKDADGSVNGFYALINDLSELKQSQDLLHATQERFRNVVGSFRDHAIFSTDVEGIIDSWNPGAENLFGYHYDEVLGRNAEILFTQEDRAKGTPADELRKARATGRASDERWYLRKDGSRFYASGTTTPLYFGRTLTGFAKIASDLTEKKRAAEALQRAHDELEVRVAERTRELAKTNSALIVEVEERKAAERETIKLLQKVVTMQEEERGRIARDLHDQLGQRLTALRLKIASLPEAFDDKEMLQTRTALLQTVAEDIDSEVSFLAWDLRPASLDELGLAEAIQAHLNEWSRHYDIAAEFHSRSIGENRLGQAVETHLYRIAQEALNNIAKHASANEVTIILEKTGGQILLIIEDNGVGFELHDGTRVGGESKGLGLAGMRERAVLIGGDIEIESSKDHGTTVFVRIPVEDIQRGTENGR